MEALDPNYRQTTNQIRKFFMVYLVHVHLIKNILSAQLVGALQVFVEVSLDDVRRIAELVS